MNLPAWLRKQTPLEMLAEQLDDAQRNLVIGKINEEFYHSNNQMLERRIARIQADMKAMMDQPERSQ